MDGYVHMTKTCPTLFIVVLAVLADLPQARGSSSSSQNLTRGRDLMNEETGWGKDRSVEPRLD